jgi:hypothetical protein
MLNTMTAQVAPMLDASILHCQMSLAIHTIELKGSIVNAAILLLHDTQIMLHIVKKSTLILDVSI